MPTHTPLVWDQDGERYYETGVNKGVLFVFKNDAYQSGVAWNGLTNVSEKPSGAEATALYADNIKYLNLISNEEFGATIEAYTYPDEFAECDGSAALATGVMIGQQKRLKFAFSYQTRIGNDTDGSDKGYKIHIVYGCMAAPTEKGYATINDSPEAITFSWEVTTTPVKVTDHRPTACVTIDSTKVDAEKLAELEAWLYGSTENDSTLPTISKLLEIFGEDSDDDEEEIVNGDGDNPGQGGETPAVQGEG